MSITTILSVYKRPEYLAEQLNAVFSQTKPSERVWLWINKCEENPQSFAIPEKYASKVDIFVTSKNMKYHARLSLALLASSEYISILDDDTIPGPNWYENCLDSMRDNPGIMGGAGCILNSRLYWQHERMGWPVQNEKTTAVDLVGHAWFFKRQELTHMWKEVPFTFENGEDIQFGYLAKKHGGIQSYCPPHPPGKPALWSSLKAVEYGNDEKASSNGSLMPIPEFYAQRDCCISHAIDNGWETVRGIK